MKAIAVLAYLALIGAGLYGYVWNIVTLIHHASAPLTSIDVLLVLRVLGIFVAPLGAILGYF